MTNLMTKRRYNLFFSIDRIYDFHEDNNDLLELFLSQPDESENLRNEQYNAANVLLAQNFQETCTIPSLQSTFHDIFPLQSITNTQSQIIEISPGKTLNIGNHLDSSQQEKLIRLLKKYQKAFAWITLTCMGFTPTHALTTFTLIAPLNR